MTPYASVALFRRNGAVVFKPPRKERPDDTTQARKAAMRFWRGNLATGDALVKVIVLREFGGRLEISERASIAGKDKPWIDFDADITASLKEPHLAACIAELGIDPAKAAPEMPDTLEINGVIYRREI
jgi:hypothetical protein